MSADEEETFGLRPDDMNAIAEVISSAIAGVGDTDVDDIELELFKLLLTDDDRLSPKAEDACTAIFKQFDKDQDGALNDEELDAFAITCNGEPFTAEEKEEIYENFECVDKAVTLEGFLNIFALQSCARPVDIMEDIKKFGFDDKLDKIDNKSEGSPLR